MIAVGVWKALPSRSRKEATVGSECALSDDCATPQERLVCEELQEMASAGSGGGGHFSAEWGESVKVEIRGSKN